MPTTHVVPPPITKNSKVAITLQRQWCGGTCDYHTVTVSPVGVVFQGAHGVADGIHRDKIDNDALLSLAKKFAAANFYSMEDSYGNAFCFASSLSITIDGRTKGVRDCVGKWAGMPTVILELEDEVDAVARTKRWIEGGEGLVAALRAEKFDFASYDAQRILENAALGGQTATVRELLAAGVPVKPLPAPKIDNPYGGPFEEVQLLTAASAHPDTLQVLLNSGVSEYDQKDKDLALDFAAKTGKLEAVRALIAYGANPTADLNEARIATVDPNVIIGKFGPGSVLIDAARSGNPEVVKEILSYGPSLEIRDYEGRTALFVASESTRSDEDEGRVECVHILAKAGAKVDAR